MRVRDLLAGVCILTSPIALGCSPANVGGSPSTGGDMNIVDACQQSADARCMYLETCSTSALQFRFGNTNTCRSTFEQLCINSLSAPSTGATPTQVAQCATQFNTSDWNCGDFLVNQSPPPACAPVMGQLPNGSGCSDYQQCASGYCALPVDAACGTCMPMPAAGTSCAEFVCPVGLTCEAATLTCAAFLKSGAMCNTGQPCEDGLTCVGATATSLGVCEQGTQVEGQGCDFAGAGCDFTKDLACNAATSVCNTETIAAPGEACGIVANQAATCSGGTCIRGACVANIPVGGACNIATGAPCTTNARCIVSTDGGTTGTCQFNGFTACP
jgi:hypothetical protein